MGLIPGMPVAVDYFKKARVAVYFLTHAHADHTEGLSPSWDRGTIYCTTPTRTVILRKFNVNADRVIALKCGEQHRVTMLFSQ